MKPASEKQQECARATIAASQKIEAAIEALEGARIATRARGLLDAAATEMAIVCEYVRAEVL